MLETMACATAVSEPRHHFPYCTDILGAVFLLVMSAQRNMASLIDGVSIHFHNSVTPCVANAYVHGRRNVSLWIVHQADTRKLPRISRHDLSRLVVAHPIKSQDLHAVFRIVTG